MDPRRVTRNVASILLLGLLLGGASVGIGGRRTRAPWSPSTTVAGLTVASADAQTVSDLVQPFEVEGTRIRVRKADGSFASNAELVGAVLVAREAGGIRNSFRIDSVDVDADDPGGDVVLYSLSVKDRETGAWRNACMPDAKGLAKGFPLEGTWSATGEHLHTPKQFEMTCTGGAYGKCVRWGYKPWKSESMWDRHQACTRMVRADYCGDGIGHTRNGTPIDIYDEIGIQRDEPAPGMSFEAGWGKDGAVCVRKTRLPDVLTLDGVGVECGARLVDLLGEACTEAHAKLDGRTLVLNKS
ncbi:MAG: ADYC domain-containing protein [Polyangiales bacterium]